MFYVYILKSEKDKKHYIGSTKSMRRRLAEHNEGSVFSTKHRRPLTIIYLEGYKAESDARKREQNLKLRSRAYTQLMKRIQSSIA